jgi:hypothetical protein
MTLFTTTPWSAERADHLLEALRHTLVVLRVGLQTRHPSLAELRHPSSTQEMTDLVARLLVGRVDEILELVDEYQEAERLEAETAYPF